MDVPEIAEVFKEAFDEDPYGIAAALIKETLEAALDDGVSGEMSAHEYDILSKIAILFTSLDPAIDISPRPA